MLIVQLTLGILGFFIAAYAFMLQRKVKRDPSYKPICDISDSMSCTKPITSPYACLFFISNPVLAMIFYGIVILLAAHDATTLLLYTSIAGITMSALFAYFLYFKIKTFCILCTSLYILNIALLLTSIVATISFS